MTDTPCVARGCGFGYGYIVAWKPGLRFASSGLLMGLPGLRFASSGLLLGLPGLRFASSGLHEWSIYNWGMNWFYIGEIGWRAGSISSPSPCETGNHRYWWIGLMICGNVCVVCCVKYPSILMRGWFCRNISMRFGPCHRYVEDGIYPADWGDNISEFHDDYGEPKP